VRSKDAYIQALEALSVANIGLCDELRKQNQLLTALNNETVKGV
jgi:hypothetical protein